MNLMYVVKNPDTHTASARFFESSHWIQLSSGEILLTAKFSTIQAEKIWTSQPNVTALPHPLSGSPIGAAIAARLTDLQAASTDTTFAVAEKANAIHPQMGIHIT